jgi:hypothetical protein
MKATAAVLVLMIALVPTQSLAQRGGGARGGGFNLNRDVAPATANVNRNAGVNGNTVNRNANVSGNTSVNGNTVNRYGNVNAGNTVNVNRTVVANPVYHGPAWGWNRGVVWAPVPTYWGGGFWGPLAIGATSAAVYGSIVNSQTHQTYTSYQTQPSSPGATLLSNYGLTQVQCGPPSGLVVIYGPSNSVICATPNDRVAAGSYGTDPSNLTIVSR